MRGHSKFALRDARPISRIVFGKETCTMKALNPLAAALVLGTVLSLTIPLPARAEEPMSAADIQAKLKGPKLTRSLKVTPRDQSKKELEAILKRSIGVVERKKIVELAEKAELPRIDFSVEFDFNSSDINQTSYPTLDTLAEALKSPDLQESKFLINGHTDSKGSDEYNEKLSQLRANSVVMYLVSQHDIDKSRFKAIGFGETALKNVSDGESAENRRVEIINRQ
jgi:outer membrane protein OmpA-like peptidoglycan-associated protein